MPPTKSLKNVPTRNDNIEPKPTLRACSKVSFSDSSSPITAPKKGPSMSPKGPPKMPIIKNFIFYACDPMTGETLPNGDKVITGLSLDKNFQGGCYRIEDIDLKVYGLNQAYKDFVNNSSPTPITFSPDSIQWM